MQNNWLIVVGCNNRSWWNNIKSNNNDKKIVNDYSLIMYTATEEMTAEKYEMIFNKYGINKNDELILLSHKHGPNDSYGTTEETVKILNWNIIFAVLFSGEYTKTANEGQEYNCEDFPFWLASKINSEIESEIKLEGYDWKKLKEELSKNIYFEPFLMKLLALDIDLIGLAEATGQAKIDYLLAIKKDYEEAKKNKKELPLDMFEDDSWEKICLISSKIKQFAEKAKARDFLGKIKYQNISSQTESEITETLKFFKDKMKSGDEPVIVSFHDFHCALRRIIKHNLQ